jgi:hypothetical protein
MADQINITVVENVEIINITVSTSVPNIIVEVADPGGGGGGAVDSVNGQTGVVVLTTTDINEGSNLYFTTARAIAALAATLLNYVTNSSLANTLLNYATTLQLADKQDKRIVISSNTTAVIDGAYTLVANATFTDPTPQEGKGFSVLIRNGIATIGGTTYSTTGTIVWRVFHSGSWTNYVNELFITPGTTAQYYRGDKTFQTLDKTAVGLGNVPNLDTSTTANITDSTNKRFVNDANLTVIGNTSGTNTGNETAASIGAIVNGATNYTTPQDADKIGIWDVANALFKALTWANLKATLKTYFDTLYTTTAVVAAQISTALTGYLTAATAAATYATIASQPRSIFMDSGDQATTSSVAADITELVFSVQANKRYFVHAHIRVGCNNTGGVKIAATVPAGATFYNALLGRSGTTTPASVAIGVINTSGSLSTPTFIVANNAFGFIEIAGEFTIGANAGNVQFQFASGVNLQTSTVYQQGTLITITELL